VQTAQRNSLRLLQWMMVASLALPLALFAFASAVSWVSIRETANREIERALDVAHEHALKVFETIDRSLSEIAEIIRDVPDADIVAREQLLHLRLKQLVASLRIVEAKHLANRDLCDWCETGLPKKRRSDKRTCSATCRTAAATDRRRRSG